MKLLNTLATAKPLVFGSELMKEGEGNKLYRAKTKYDSVEKFLRAFYKDLVNNKTYPKLLTALGSGLSIEDATKMILIIKMAKGEANYMLFPLYVEPMMIVLYYWCRKAKIMPIIYDTQNEDLTEEEIKLFFTGGR